ncbi:MAG TPA: glycosyltransferase family 4 protein [Pyrinomonadaceae bacterium]|jgi:glycosyltransferase involved in cell wall biosynthesis|nr:glycosyltransferase family 4 protein [Pyrinomonadaceae bacterium]
MRLLAIVPSIYDTSPGQRYRLEQWEPLLRKRGVEITYAPFESEELHALLYKPGSIGRKLSLVTEGMSRRYALMKSVRDYDVVYVFREAALLGPPFFERWIHRSGVPMVFDFDDAVFVSYRSPTNGYLSYLKFASKTKSICRMSAHVMAGNPYLADYARQVNANVTIVPTTIDTEKYTVIESRSESEIPTIGWTGSFSTVQHLDTLRSALQKLARQTKFRLRVIGTPIYQLDGVEVEAMPWVAATELKDLGAIDIGIMPLPDDNWSKGKCGLKALQFMALGIPTVCSPVGVNKEIIHDGENGFIAGSEDEWIGKLGRVLHSAELRSQLGQAGRRTVEMKYSANVQAPRVFELLRSVVRDAGREREPQLESQTTRVQGNDAV